MAKPVWTAERTGRALVKSLLPVRSRLAHKGDFGKVLLLCGSKGLAGAAMLAARAALRTGSGIVYLGVPEAIYSICAGACASAVVFPLACDAEGKLSLDAVRALEARLSGMDAVLFGCGVGQSEELQLLLKRLLQNCRMPLVLDADGINLLAQHMDVLRGSKCPVILTPHDGEFRRLGGNPGAKDRVFEAMRFAAQTKTILLLKGHRTIITDGLKVIVGRKQILNRPFVLFGHICAGENFIGFHGNTSFPVEFSPLIMILQPRDSCKRFTAIKSNIPLSL